MTKIESTAIIEPGAIIGDNCYIGHYTVIRPNVIIGNNTQIRAHCFIAANAIIGNNTQIMQFSNICRDCIVGDEVFVGMGCMTTNTRKIAYRRTYECKSEPPIIERAARIGAKVTILPGVIIGENAVVGAGSLVHRDLASGYIFVGSPVILLKEVPLEELI